MNKAMLNAVFSSQELFEYSSNPFAFVPVTTTSRNATRGLGGEARQLNPICVEMVIQVI